VRGRDGWRQIRTPKCRCCTSALATVESANCIPRLDRRAEFEKEVGTYFQSGKVKSKETVVKGIEQAASAFVGLFQGQNVGKMVVELAGLRMRSLIAHQVFQGHIVLTDLLGVNFRYVRVGRIFHSLNRVGLKELPLLDQFCDALRSGLRDIRQPLSVPGLAG
jgi:hypothetical protein